MTDPTPGPTFNQKTFALGAPQSPTFGMDEVPLLRLVTLWFVVLIFLRTGAGAADGPLMAAVGLVAVLLSYAIPAALVIGGAMQLLET